MITARTLSLLGLIAVAVSSPIAPVSLEARDNGACYPQNMIIGQSDYNCPKKTTTDASGHCSGPIPNVPGDAGCTGYCEVRLVASYGQEVPFTEGTCQAGTSCSMATGQSTTVTNTYSVNVGVSLGTGDDVTKVLTSAFDIGASYSYSVSVGYSTTTQHQMSLNSTSCGYWTFVPYMMMSCGTLTVATTGEQPAGYYMENEAPYCEKDSLTDTINYCNTTPYTDANGHADGAVVFVYTDCTTNAVLTYGQDSVYGFPGVSTGPKMSG